MLRIKTLFGSALLAAANLALASAAETTILPSDDTAIYGNTGEENFNAGRSPRIPSGGRGSMVNNAPVRMLMRFDISSQVPAGAQITAATARLHIARTPNGGGRASIFGFHQMLVPWIEGTTLAGNAGGATVGENGEPTWVNRAHPNTPWGAPGGLIGTDFVTAPGATRLIAAGNSVDVIIAFAFSPAGIAEIQAMLDNPSTNHGWMFMSDSENEERTARLFTTKDTLTQDAATLANRPTLTVEYTIPAAPPEDFSLTFTPDGSPTLSFTREPNTAYLIESNTSLLPSEWNMLQIIPASPTQGTSTFPVASPFPERLFFRISPQ